MKIAVDARCLNREHVRGIGKVVTNIIEHSPNSVQWTLFGDRPDFPFHRPNHNGCETEIFEQRGYRFRGWEQWAYPRRLCSSHFDLALSPANSASLWQPVPTVAIIHDTIAWNREWKSEASGFFANRFVLPRAFRETQSIVTISRASASDIVRLWPALKNKITTIPNGVDEHFLNPELRSIPKSVKRQVGANRYFLYFGGSIPRKRLDWAVKVFEKAAVEDCTLLICGLAKCDRSGFCESLSSEIKNRIKVADYVEESELPGLIQNSLGVVYPTLYEGFGLPALEAQACGTACLFSEVASLKELVGPGAVLLPIDDEDAWADALVRLANRGGLDTETATKAREWAMRYRWRESSRAYMNLFQELTTNRSLELENAEVAGS